ncbi:MAG: Ig-like domain-containing protein, partial [Chlorobiaceae bacterium]|nr:Ig-like domain-containing protein [Chlorobiaceae bacterium]
MAGAIKAVTTGNDNLYFTSEPSGGGSFTITDTGGTDYLWLADAARAAAQYLFRFPVNNFTIGPVNANGAVVVTGASTKNGSSLTFTVKGVEYIVFDDGTATGKPITVTLDYVAPTVNSFNGGTTTNVAVASNLTVTFSENVQKGTGTLNLYKDVASGTPVESYDIASNTTNLSISGNTVTINPTNDLVGGSNYFVTFASGSVKDIILATTSTGAAYTMNASKTGNIYSGGTYSFTTLSTDSTPPTVSSFSPADSTTGVAVASNVVLTFSENIQKGTSGLIKVYKGSVSGTPVETYDLATNTSANLTVSGSTLTINPTSDLTPDGSTYYVTFDAGTVKDTAGNSYAGSSTYHFATVDTTAPTVSSFSPADSAAGVAVASNVVLTFSENIQKGTSGLIKVYKGSVSGTPVETYDLATNTSANLTVSGSTLTINPTSDLTPDGSAYYVTFDAGTVKDTAGNSYAGSSIYHFATVDTTAPTVSSFSPADSAAGVAVASNVVLTFSENIQKGTSGQIKVYKGSVSGTPVETYDLATNTSANLTVSGSTLTINPTSDLAADASTYYVTFDAGTVKDTAGNSYAGSSAYHFATVDTTPPAATLVSVGPINNTVLVTVKSSEAGTAYLVRGDVSVSGLSSITGLADGTLWNEGPIATANTNTNIDAQGLADGTYRVYTADAAGNLSSASSGSILIDSTPPSINTLAISGATGALNSTLNAGDVVSVTVTMSEQVTVTGSPQLKLNVGGTLKTAAYASGSGSASLVFTYTVQSGDADADGISIDANALSLNGGTIEDAAQKSATLTFSAVGANGSYKVDTALPSSPTISLATDTGSVNNDGITSDATVNVGGVESGASWEYSTDSG